MPTNKYFDAIVVPLNKMLFDLDPMNTCCKENDMFDEYQKIATNITGWLIRGCDVTDSVKSVFDAYWWEGCLSKEKLEQIVKETNEIFDSSGVHRRP